MNLSFDRLIEVLRSLQELPEERRLNNLLERFRDDPELIEITRKILGLTTTAHGVASSKSETSSQNSSTDFPASSDQASPVDYGSLMSGAAFEIGKYKLLKQIGEGGFGTVYEAEQMEPVRRRVALKIVKVGMDTKAVIGRFNLERQALAMMDHPHIAKVFDAGATKAGRPYFVMELVRGIPINQYCDKHCLGVEDRVSLFVKVCHALQHAHQKGIIHRDIKPNNILVTEDDGGAVPKIIDFGIAKATISRPSDFTVYTDRDQFIGTPAYMSPEQTSLDRLDIDTASDIYSLGVVFYELLVGRLPIDPDDYSTAGLEALLEAIRRKDVLYPSVQLKRMPPAHLDFIAIRRGTDSSRLVRRIHGDLDWIVTKCLEKDRSRRYATAIGLAADLSRHLNHEVVSARPQSIAYQSAKFIRRHRAAIGLSLLVTVSLLVSLVFWYSGKRARAEKALVNIAREQGYAALGSTIERCAIQYSTNPADNFVITILSNIEEEIENKMTGSPDLQVQGLVELGNTYSELGRDEDADRAYENAQKIADTHPGIALPLKKALLMGISRLNEEDDREKALDYARRATDLFTGKEQQYPFEYAEALDHLAGVQLEMGSFAAAEQNQRAVVDIYRKSNDHIRLALALCDLGSILGAERNLHDATNVFQQGMDQLLRLSERDETDELICLTQWASVLLSQGKCEEATNKIAAAITLVREGRTTVSSQSETEERLLNDFQWMAKCFLILGDIENAIQYQSQSFSIVKDMASDDSNLKIAKTTLAVYGELRDDKESTLENEDELYKSEDDRRMIYQNLGSLYCAHCLQKCMEELVNSTNGKHQPMSPKEKSEIVNRVAGLQLPRWVQGNASSSPRARFAAALDHKLIVPEPKDAPNRASGEWPTVYCKQHQLQIGLDRSVRPLNEWSGPKKMSRKHDTREHF